jgi:hypothetical protein
VTKITLGHMFGIVVVIELLSIELCQKPYHSQKKEKKKEREDNNTINIQGTISVKLFFISKT